MERCFDHFIRLLEFREAEDELLALSTTAAEQLTDAWAERLFQLKRDIEADRAILDSTEQELAEMAAGLGQKTIGPPGLAAAHGSRLTPSLERPPEF